MFVNYHTCDHCGKRLDTMNDYEDIDIQMTDWFSGVDLCADCFDELEKLVTDFIHREVVND